MTTPPHPKTGIVMLNMGGPADLNSVGPFLYRLFLDREIIQLPCQKWLGRFIARRRTPKVQKLYAEIGGKTPILDSTQTQALGLEIRLDQTYPESAPHKAYIAFRYTPPFAEEALRQMHKDGIQRAVAFTQYPQFSCATTGSSLNELWRACRREKMEKTFSWSVIDRWPTHPGFIQSVADQIELSIREFPENSREDILLLFSAHSLPLSVVDRGDPYPQECGASVHSVMSRLRFSHEYILAYQSSVGPVRWLGPSTESVLRNLGLKKRKRVLVVPIAFTTDHIETLSEIDIEYAQLAQEVGITDFRRVPAANDTPAFLDALSDIVGKHLESSSACSRQYKFPCPGCTNPECRNIINPIQPDSRY